MKGAWERAFVPALFVLLFVCALAIRVDFAFQWQDMPYGSAPLLDARAYDAWAWDLAQGKGKVAQVFYQSPLYPYLLSVLYRIVGHSYLAASLLNDVLDSATVVLLSGIALMLFGSAAAVITGVLAATCAPMIFYTAPVMKEPLVLFLLALFVLLSLRALFNNCWRNYAFGGFILGLAVLARGNVILLMPIVPLLGWFKYRRDSARGIVIFLAAALIAILPATRHNYQAAHDFVLTTSDGGFNLYVGHSSYANGSNTYPPEINTDPQQEEMLDTSWVAEHETGRKLSPSQVSAFWRDKAIDFALHNPWREVELLGKKFFAFWNDANGFDNYDIEFIKRNFPSVLNRPLAGFWLIAPLAIFATFAGAWRLKAEAKPGFLFLCLCAFGYMASVLIFYVLDRYRLPVVVFLLPLAGAPVPCAVELLREKAWLRLAAGLSAALIFLGIALHAPLNPVDFTAYDWGILVGIDADKGEDRSASEAFAKGQAISPTAIGSQAYVRIAGIAEKNGRIDDAEQTIKQAAILFPEDGVIFYNLGRMQALRGDLDAAIDSMHKAQELKPVYMLTYFALAKLYEHKGQLTKAREALMQGLAIDPTDERLGPLAQEWGVN